MNQKAAGPKGRPGRRPQWAAVWLLLLGMVVVGGVFFAGRAWAGPSDAPVRVPVLGPPLADLCPELPGGLYFGDSPQTVLEKMGRPPDETFRPADNRYFWAYGITPRYGFVKAVLLFRFMDDRFDTLGVRYGYPVGGDAEGAAKFASAADALESRLTALLGAPPTLKADSLDNLDALEDVTWKREGNVVTLTRQPLIDGARAAIVFITPVND